MTSCANESMGRLIYKTSLSLRNFAEKMLSPYDLTVEQLHLLKSASSAAGLSQNQLCLQLGKNPANISRILDRLEKKKWIARESNPSDRRSSLVVLTDEGKRVIDEVSSKFESYSHCLMEGINNEEEGIFRRVLEKIDENVLKMVNEIDREKE